MLSIFRISVLLSIKVGAALLFLARPTGAQIFGSTDTGAFLPGPLDAWLETFPIMAWTAGCVTVACIAVFVGRRMRAARRAARAEILGLPDGGRLRVVDVMVHAVWTERSISETRVERALEIARNTTNMDYTSEHMREAAFRADRLILPMNFHWVGSGLSQEEKLVIFNAAVSVLLADGPLTKTDKAFLRVLTRGLGLNHNDLRDLSRLVPN